MIYPDKYGGIPSTGSRDIMGARICHANADADTNGIRTEINTSPLTFGGGEIISQTVLMLKSGQEYMLEMAIFNVQRAINPKVCNQELRFLCSARRLIVLNTCMKFHENL